MMTLKIAPNIDDVDPNLEGLSTAVFEGPEIESETADWAVETGQSETNHWYIWVPMAGVRYYTYGDRPSPVAGTARPNTVKLA